MGRLSDIRIKLGKSIRKKRRSMDITQEELCRKAGCFKQVFLSKIENGHKLPTNAALKEISRCLESNWEIRIEVFEKGEKL